MKFNGYNDLIDDELCFKNGLLNNITEKSVDEPSESSDLPKVSNEHIQNETEEISIGSKSDAKSSQDTVLNLKFDDSQAYETRVKQSLTVFAYLYKTLRNSMFQNFILKNKLSDFVEALTQIQYHQTEPKSIKSKKKAYKECINLNIFYKCPYDKCGKVYSNEIQLNVHILSKHNGGTKKARLNYILKAWNALNEKKPIPECEFSLPESFQFNINKAYKNFDSFNNGDLEFCPIKFLRNLIVFDDKEINQD